MRKTRSNNLSQYDRETQYWETYKQNFGLLPNAKMTYREALSRNYIEHLKVIPNSEFPDGDETIPTAIKTVEAFRIYSRKVEGWFFSSIQTCYRNNFELLDYVINVLRDENEYINFNECLEASIITNSLECLKILLNYNKKELDINFDNIISYISKEAVDLIVKYYGKTEIYRAISISGRRDLRKIFNIKPDMFNMVYDPIYTILEALKRDDMKTILSTIMLNVNLSSRVSDLINHLYYTKSIYFIDILLLTGEIRLGVIICVKENDYPTLKEIGIQRITVPEKLIFQRNINLFNMLLNLYPESNRDIRFLRKLGWDETYIPERDEEREAEDEEREAEDEEREAEDEEEIDGDEERKSSSEDEGLSDMFKRTKFVR